MKNPPPHRLALHWHRRDLRISDNHALWKASTESAAVLPVYFPSTWSEQHPWTGSARQHFLCQSLDSLAKNLNTIGGRLLIRAGDPLTLLPGLISESGAEALYFNLAPDPYGQAIDQKVIKLCAELGVACHPCHDHSLHAPDEVLKNDGDPYRVFTPYFKTWQALSKPEPFPKAEALNSPAEPAGEDLPDLSHWQLPDPPTDLPPAGEKAARQQLRTFLEEGLASYAKQRDFPALTKTTSGLSPHLRHGTISPRQILAALHKHQKAGAEKFLQELAWREFYFAILHHFPEVLELEFNPVFRGLSWDEPDEKWEAWKQGRTGFPLVDAGLRELLATGTMHNRVRMVVSMFLTKDLRYDWRLGEQFFMQHLIDGEIASNNGGWQWSAGTGADAAPYFRIQNPWTQSKRYDPDAEYIHRWLPELRDVPAAKLHQPPPDGQALTSDYPAPIVDHARERKATLARFQKHREQQK